MKVPVKRGFPVAGAATDVTCRFFLPRQPAGGPLGSGRRAAHPSGCRGRVKIELRGEWFERDGVSEFFELADEPFGALVGGASVEVVGAELSVGGVLGEDVVGGDEDRVAERAGCLAGAATAAKACVLGAEVGALAPRRGFRRFGQRRLQPFGSVAWSAGAALAGRFVVAGRS